MHLLRMPIALVLAALAGLGATKLATDVAATRGHLSQQRIVSRMDEPHLLELRRFLKSAIGGTAATIGRDI